MAALVVCDCSVYILFAGCCTVARCVSFILITYPMIPYCTEMANKNTRKINHKLTQSEGRAKPELQAVAVGIRRMREKFRVGISNSFGNIM